MGTIKGSGHSGLRSSPAIELERIDELHDIKNRLEMLLHSLGGEPVTANHCHSSDPGAVRPTERCVREIIRARTSRAKCFRGDLFADPAWDMLLELYAAELGMKQISVSSLCIAASVPATTALRWINVLEREGLISRRSDPKDGRRTFVHLSQSGVAGMDTFFASTIEAHRTSEEFSTNLSRVA